jgi:predicted ferric reductase
VEGPYGGFWHGGAQIPRQIWIAGGIGVTPFLSMARGMPDGIQADLYYCAATAEALVFLDELEAVAADRPGLRVIANPDDAKGLLTAAEVARRSGDLSRAHVYLCGPPAMVRALPADLEAVGVARSRIHWEEFRLGGLRDR